MRYAMRDIPGFEGKYAVTSDGRVWSYPRGVVVMGRWLKFNKDRKGYLKVHLRRCGKTKNHIVHRLVAITFIPNRKRLPQVNHKNGIKSDNSVRNLEWVSAADNIRHSLALGLTDTRTKAKLKACRESIVKARAALAEKRRKIL